MFIERTQDADTRVARFAVESYRLISMFAAFDVFFGLDIEQRVAACYLDPPSKNK
jgi:hypothetical protein